MGSVEGTIGFATGSVAGTVGFVVGTVGSTVGKNVRLGDVRLRDYI